jgi:hypothetical protein
VSERFVTIVLDRQDMAARGRIGAYRRWATTPDRAAATEPARAAFRSKFEREVDPDGLLTPEKRAELAEYARKAHFARLGRRSGQARRRAAGAVEAAA